MHLNYGVGDYSQCGLNFFHFVPVFSDENQGQVSNVAATGK
jgi:hypothetical protein